MANLGTQLGVTLFALQVRNQWVFSETYKSPRVTGLMAARRDPRRKSLASNEGSLALYRKPPSHTTPTISSPCRQRD
jgi:hypothetical protein